MSLSIPVHNAQVSPADPTQNPTLVQPVLSLEVEQLAADGETPQQIASSLSTPVTRCLGVTACRAGRSRGWRITRGSRFRPKAAAHRRALADWQWRRPASYL